MLPEPASIPVGCGDKSRSRAEGGAGLGLALCQGIASLHRGALHFESRVGEGTVVTVELGGVEVA